MQLTSMCQGLGVILSISKTKQRLENSASVRNFGSGIREEKVGEKQTKRIQHQTA